MQDMFALMVSQGDLSQNDEGFFTKEEVKFN
jgi:hypothetical protein